MTYMTYYALTDHTAREGSHAYHHWTRRPGPGWPRAAAGPPTTVQPDLPSRLQALLPERQSDEDLIARFLLGYRYRTRAAYRADLRDFRAWCVRIRIGLLDVRRSHIEAYSRQLEQAGRSRATVARRLTTLTGFYRYAVQEGTLPHSPVAHVRRPSVMRRCSSSGSACSTRWRTMVCCWSWSRISCAPEIDP